MISRERDRGVREDLFMDLRNPPCPDQHFPDQHFPDQHFWLAQALLVGTLLVYLGVDLAQDQGIIPTPGFVWILLLFVPIIYAGSTFGLTGSVAVALEGIVFSIPQVLLFPHSTTQLWGAWSVLALALAVAILLGKRFDKERERLAAEHLEMDQRFKFTFANNVAGMLVTDLDGRALAVNNSYCKMLGRKSKELLGRDSTSVIFPEDRSIAEKTSARMLAGGESLAIYTKRYQHKDGHMVWAEVSRSLVHDEIGKPQYFINSVRDITEERSLLAQLSHQALHDPLTGLANRVMFEDRLTQALVRAARENKNLAVLLIDLDEFKDINDTFGHQIGDDLLVEVARRLEQLTRSADTLCRFGGDEFLYLSEGLTSTRGAEKMAEHLLGVFDEPFTIGGESVDQAASIGLAICVGGKGCVDLLRNADTALSDAKRQGKNRYTLFRPEMHDQVSDRSGLVQELRRSFESDEILMNYQPIVDLATSQTVGLEALMRWNHPEHGWVSPSVFIPLAEQSKLIFDLGFFALRQAIAEAASWPHIDQREKQPYVTVNLSPRQFHDPDLLSKIKEVLETNEFEPGRLVLEITEGAAFADIDTATRVVARLRQLGVALAIDDFGTGYSSLSYFTLLRPSILKVDQSFVNRAHDSANGERLLEAIITIGNSLDATVVAEGIETIAQLEMLRRLGYRFGQGYLFSPPVPSADLADMFESAPICYGVSSPRHVATIPINHHLASSGERRATHRL